MRMLACTASAAFFLVAASAATAGASDFVGTWQIESRIDATGCEDGMKTENVEATVSQKGDKLVFALGPVTLDAELKGDDLHVTGGYEHEGLITKDLKLRIEDGKMVGGGSWTYSAEGFECEGTETFNGTKSS